MSVVATQPLSPVPGGPNEELYRQAMEEITQRGQEPYLAGFHRAWRCTNGCGILYAKVITPPSYDDTASAITRRVQEIEGVSDVDLLRGFGGDYITDTKGNAYANIERCAVCEGLRPDLVVRNQRKHLAVQAAGCEKAISVTSIEMIGSFLSIPPKWNPCVWQDYTA